MYRRETKDALLNEAGGADFWARKSLYLNKQPESQLLFLSIKLILKKIIVR
jgi:hypothetical protein